MSFLTFFGIGISGLAAAVPKQTIYNSEYTAYFPADIVSEIVDKTGIVERRFAPIGMCASDLCEAAAIKLMQEMGLTGADFDAILFISQTADYRMPATAIILQHKLGLPKSAMAFDISLGCSGFVYGLSIAYSLLLQPNFRRILLLDGETRSRVYHPKDRKTAFLFGDGGVAAIIEKDKRFGNAFFNLGSDGSKSHLIKMDAGGYRNPSTPETLQEKVVDELGNIRTDEHGYMDGAEVFNFVLEEIPGNIKDLFGFASKQLEDIDFAVFHQANAFMNTYLAKKLKLPANKCPSSIAKFGNTSSVSIPLTMVSEMQETLKQHQHLLLSGFGVGMSWASALIDLHQPVMPDLIEI